MEHDGCVGCIFEKEVESKECKKCKYNYYDMYAKNEEVYKNQEKARIQELYWYYFINIENDMINTLKYVEPEPENLKTFSVEYAKIINVACSEIDVLMKEICNKISDKEVFKKNSTNGTIKKYAEIILTKYSSIVDCELTISRGKTGIKPFQNWKVDSSPRFWKEYQDIKHHRNSSFSSANLQNALHSIGALRILNLYWIRMNNSNKYCLANKNSELFISKYTSNVLFMGENTDIEDFIEPSNPKI